MGQTVGPVTSKQSGGGSAGEMGLMWGYSGMQGWRPSMEDAHFAVAGQSYAGWEATALFGVLDGHGGSQVARFCEKHLPTVIAEGPYEDVGQSLVDAFHRMDEMLEGSMFTNARAAGCTAVVCCVRPDSIVVANAGDSRAVLCRGGRAVPLSFDHKPTLPVERARIEKAGGGVFEMHYGPITVARVNQDLSLSRAIGDLRYKDNPNLPPEEQIICATPDIMTFLRQPNDEFIILACDGIWDVMSSEDAVQFVRERLPRACEGQAPGEIYSTREISIVAEDMLDHCLSPDVAETFGRGGDNMTVVVVVFDTNGITNDWTLRNTPGSWFCGT